MISSLIDMVDVFEYPHGLASVLRARSGRSIWIETCTSTCPETVWAPWELERYQHRAPYRRHARSRRHHDGPERPRGRLVRLGLRPPEKGYGRDAGRGSHLSPDTRRRGARGVQGEAVRAHAGREGGLRHRLGRHRRHRGRNHGESEKGGVRRCAELPREFGSVAWSSAKSGGSPPRQAWPAAAGQAQDPPRRVRNVVPTSRPNPLKRLVPTPRTAELGLAYT